MADETRASESSSGGDRPDRGERRPSSRPGGPGGGREGGGGVDASISGARRFASSASKRLKRSTTRTFVCWRSSWRKAEESCPAV